MVLLVVLVVLVEGEEGGIMVQYESLLSNGAFSHQHRPHCVRWYQGVLRCLPHRGRETLRKRGKEKERERRDP